MEFAHLFGLESDLLLGGGNMLFLPGNDVLLAFDLCFARGDLRFTLLQAAPHLCQLGTALFQIGFPVLQLHSGLLQPLLFLVEVLPHQHRFGDDGTDEENEDKEQSGHQVGVGDPEVLALFGTAVSSEHQCSPSGPDSSGSREA